MTGKFYSGDYTDVEIIRQACTAAKVQTIVKHFTIVLSPCDSGILYEAAGPADQSTLAISLTWDFVPQSLWSLERHVLGLFAW